MAKQSFEAAIADLERSNGPAEEVLAKAADILGLNLQANLDTCSTEVRFRCSSQSPGFKEQWLLRWLLKTLNTPNAGTGTSMINSESLLLLPEFWSLLLHLTSRIADELCLEILLERRFFHTLDESIRLCLAVNKPNTGSESPSPSVIESKEPPTKRRRLSPPAPAEQTPRSNHAKLIWVLLQASCRCVDLVALSSMRSKGKVAPTWTASWNDQASLFGQLLQAVAFLLKKVSRTEEQSVLSQIFSTVSSFWKGDSTAIRTQTDDPHRAFASYSLKPTLILLDTLLSSHLSDRRFASSKNTLERLIAMHVVFPFRSIFNERYAKKLRNVHDTLLYEHLESMLKGFRERVLVLDYSPEQSKDHFTSVPLSDLSWIILDVAARSVPASDLRKRQQEQPWVESLFICLVHLVWPRIPQITATGVVQPDISASSALRDRKTWIAPLEKLVEATLTLKVRISLPVLGYILSAILALEEQSPPWALLAKVVRLDINVLVPSTGLSSSGHLLKQVLEKVESDDVSAELYALIREDIVLALLRAFARTRHLDDFVTMWQQNLAEAIRVRYTSKDQADTAPAALIWDDEDVFDEFKSLVFIHAPPSMAQRLLHELLEQMKGLPEKVGSTADVFAKLAVFSTILELTNTQDASVNLDTTQLADLFRQSMTALPRKSDYQAQRWRLWRLLRMLVPKLDWDNLPDFEQLFQPGYNFMSLDEVNKPGRPDETRKRAAKFLECLECFSLTVELAARNTSFQENLKSELSLLTELMIRYDTMPSASPLWDGRSFDCDDAGKLIAACIGRLLQRPEVFHSCPDALKGLIDKSSDLVIRPHASSAKGISLPSLEALLNALLNTDEAVNNLTLRQIVLQRVAETLESVDEPLDRSLLQGISMEMVKKSQLKNIGAAATRRLIGATQDVTLEAIANNLNMLLRLDSAASRTTINCKDWRLWVELSARLLSRHDLAGSSSSWPAIHMMATILDRIWDQAVAAQNTAVLSDIFSWIKKTILVAQDGEFQQSDFLALQVFFANICQAEGSLDEAFTSHKLRNLQKDYARLLITRLNQAPQAVQSKEGIFDLKLTLNAAHRLSILAKDGQIQQAISTVQKALQNTLTSLDHQTAKDEWRMRLSIQRECLGLLLPSGPKLDEQEAQEEIQRLAGLVDHDGWTNADMSLLVTHTDILVRRIGPAAWTRIVDFLQKQSKRAGFQLVRPLTTASVILQTTVQDILQNPPLAETLAEIASLLNLSGEMTLEELFLTLENARTVLETQPLVVNQATLDKLLASICTVASAAADEHLLMSSPTSPQPSDIYDRLCAIVGAILARHRRRVSDRYHLLLPVLQALLRCLFWPGSRSLHDGNRATVAIGLNSFGQTLPRWMRESEEPLPPSAATKFSRLLSSICNPTVSAARSSKKRGHNELNDETKRAKFLAGQHMQYLVMEYARCTLDGGISPSVKERLMPGMYSVMGAMERDLLRALNAGMDPSSRAIFKTLYDDWSQYGKWDKS